MKRAASRWRADANVVESATTSGFSVVLAVRWRAAISSSTIPRDRISASHIRDDVSRSAGRAAAMLSITSSADVADVAYASAWRSESVRAVSRTCSRQIPSASRGGLEGLRCRSGPGRQLGQPGQCMGCIGMLRAEMLLLYRQSSNHQWLGVVMVAARSSKRPQD